MVNALYIKFIASIFNSPPLEGCPKGGVVYKTRMRLRTSMRMRVCVSHTRFQIRYHSADSRGFTSSLIYAALSGLGVVWVLVIFLTAKGAEEGAEIAEVLKIAWVYSGMFFTTEFFLIVNCQLLIVDS